MYCIIIDYTHVWCYYTICSVFTAYFNNVLIQTKIVRYITFNLSNVQSMLLLSCTSRWGFGKNRLFSYGTLQSTNQPMIWRVCLDLWTGQFQHPLVDSNSRGVDGTPAHLPPIRSVHTTQ